MFYEYALEPSAISTWERARYFLDALGPWKGRFLAEYPRKWKRLVYEGLACPDVDKKRIEERLSQLDRRVFLRQQRPYDSELPWLTNAVAAHASEPFRAIIGAEGDGAFILAAGDVDDRCDLWRVDAGRLVPRTAAALGDAVGLLLRVSRRVVLIDPYFRANQNDKTLPLLAILKSATNLSVPVEVHFSDAHCSHQQGMDDARRALPRVLPADVTVVLRCWRRRDNGPRLHNRYLLTDIGGVQFGDSVEEGNIGEDDRLSILEEATRARIWEQYVGTEPAFEEAGESREFRGL